MSASDERKGSGQTPRHDGTTRPTITLVGMDESARARRPDRVPVPRRLLLPPAPTGIARQDWDALSAGDQDAIVAMMASGPVPAARLPLLTTLLERRLATSWRLRVGAVVLGWLVLMTVWGFGRAQTGVVWGPWFGVGLTLGVVAGSAQWVAVSRRMTDLERRLVEVTRTTSGGA